MPQVISTPKQFQTILSENSLCVVDFYAGWCGPCKRLAPVYESLSEDTKYKSIKFLKIDVEEEIMVSLVSDTYNVSSLPTLLFFAKKEEVSRMKGIDKGELIKNLDKLLETDVNDVKEKLDLNDNAEF